MEENKKTKKKSNKKVEYKRRKTKENYKNHKQE